MHSDNQVKRPKSGHSTTAHQEQYPSQSQYPPHVLIGHDTQGQLRNQQPHHQNHFKANIGYPELVTHGSLHHSHERHSERQISLPIEEQENQGEQLQNHSRHHLPHIKVVSDMRQFNDNRSHGSSKSVKREQSQLAQVAEKKDQEAGKQISSKLNLVMDKDEFNIHKCHSSEALIESVQASEPAPIVYDETVNPINEADPAKEEEIVQEKTPLQQQIDRLQVDEVDAAKKKKMRETPEDQEISECIPEQKNENEDDVPTPIKAVKSKLEHEEQFIKNVTTHDKVPPEQFQPEKVINLNVEPIIQEDPSAAKDDQ